MYYLSARQILALHSATVQETKGAYGIRDLDAIKTLESLPRQSFGGKKLYPAIFLKAAVYARNIIAAHPFIDGNKRTGMVVAFVFLKENGYEATAKNGEIEKFAMNIATQKLSLKIIAQWFKTHNKK